MKFGFYCPAQIIMESGCIERAGPMAAGMGRRVLAVVPGSLSKSHACEALRDGAAGAGAEVMLYVCPPGEPTCKSVDEAAEVARDFRADVLVGMGGGSAMDTAKAVCGMYLNPGSVMDYLEGVGTGAVMEKPPLPWIALPTTAGTGAEVTKNAVISGEGFKKSFRDSRLYARAVLVDPGLTLSLPKEVTADSGMDALTQLIESFVSVKATPITDALAVRGIALAKSLRDAYNDGLNLPARENMSATALLSGICLANSGLGAAHGIAAALGIYAGIPHGRACALLLPHVIELNARDSAAAEKLKIAARLFTGEGDIAALTSKIREWNAHFCIPADLKSYNISGSVLKKIAEGSFGSSMSGNPVQQGAEDWEIFLQALV